MKFKKPKFWDSKKPNFLAYILLPLTLPIIINNYLLRFKTKKKNENIKTICIGNIYLGGTGKTPTTIKLYEILDKLKFKVSTAKKFYSTQIDENLILQNKTKFISGTNRHLILKQAIKNHQKVVIFDDGLQEKTISYNLQFVCFDAKTFIGNSFLIPAGPLREKICSLKKYDGVFLKNDNGVNDFQISLIKKYNPKINIFLTSSKINNLVEFNLDDKYLIFSGIGNPESFGSLLKKNNFNILDEIVFPDHHNYSNKEIVNIINKAEENNAKIITTEKDYVKIPKEYSTKIKYLDISLKIQDEERLINFLKDNLYE